MFLVIIHLNLYNTNSNLPVAVGLFFVVTDALQPHQFTFANLVFQLNKEFNIKTVKPQTPLNLTKY